MRTLAVILALFVFELASISVSPAADENHSAMDLPKYINDSRNYLLVELDDDDNADDQILPKNKTNMEPFYISVTGPLNNPCFKSLDSFAKATELFYSYSFNEAIDNLNDTINSCPDHASDALYNRGYIEYKQGKYEEAKLDFGKALELDKTNADYWGFMGIVLLEEGNYEEALSALNKSIDIDPNCSYAKNRKYQALELLSARKS